MADKRIIHQARKNGNSSQQYAGQGSINVRRLINLLEQSAQPNRHRHIRSSSNKMLHLMAKNTWRISAGPHTGGTHGDAIKHITIKMTGKPQFHLRMDKKGHLFSITCGKKRQPLDEVPFWNPPGV